MPRNFDAKSYESGAIRHRSVEHDIAEYPEPSEVYESVTKSLISPRDRALVSMIYIAALRESEVIQIRRHQFEEASQSIHVSRINVLKKKQPVVRDFDLPLTGDRAPFTELIHQWLNEVKEPSAFVWAMDRTAVYRVVIRTGKWPHYYRALGEQYLYDKTKDVIAVANKLKIHPRTLPIYVHDRDREVPVV